MHQDIIDILQEAGEKGLRLQKLILHVYNRNNNLFHPISKEDVRAFVLNFIRTNSRSKDDLITKVQRGVYKINTDSPKLLEQRILFFESENEQEETIFTPYKNGNSQTLFEKQKTSQPIDNLKYDSGI